MSSSRRVPAFSLALLLCICGSSFLYAQTSQSSPPTGSGLTPPLAPPLEYLLKAEATLTLLLQQAKEQTALVKQQNADLLRLSSQFQDSEARLKMLGQQLDDSSRALDQSKVEQMQLKTLLLALSMKFEAQSQALQQASEASAALQTDCSNSLKAERAKLLPWQIAGIVGAAVAVVAGGYLGGHALGVW